MSACPLAFHLRLSDHVTEFPLIRYEKSEQRPVCRIPCLFLSVQLAEDLVVTVKYETGTPVMVGRQVVDAAY